MIKQILSIFSLLLLPYNLYAGAFIFADDTNGVNLKTFVTGYNPSSHPENKELVVTLCIDPNITLPAGTTFDQVEESVLNAIRTFNCSIYNTTSNLSFSASGMDFESVFLHELGHCLGLAHPNLASESGLGSPQNNSTRTTQGSNSSYDVNSGSDTIYGSADDTRGDDVNLHWFKYNQSTASYNNNPFQCDPVESTIYDNTSMTRDLANLPAGDNFAANGDRDVATTYGYSSSTIEVVMQQGTFSSEQQLELGCDDVETLALAKAGDDGTDTLYDIDNQQIGSAGDDYIVTVIYAGRSNSATMCDIIIQETTSGLASCAATGFFLPSNNAVLSDDLTININFDGYSWSYNTITSTVNKNAVTCRMVEHSWVPFAKQ